MKLRFIRWKWRRAMLRREKHEVDLPKIKSGYVSKKAGKHFENTMLALDGKTVRVKIEKETVNGCPNRTRST